MNPCSAAQSFVAFSIRVSRTGWRSKVERLMIFSTSAVAVCCCSDFAQLVEQADVFDGDNDLIGKARQERDLLVREGANFLTKDNDGSNEVIVLKHRHSDGGSNATKLDGVDDRWIALGIRSCRCNVGGLDGLLGSDQLAQGTTRGGMDRTASARLGKCPRHIVAGDDAQCPAFMEIEAAELGLANAYRVCQHRLKYRLKLARRA